MMQKFFYALMVCGAIATTEVWARSVVPTQVEQPQSESKPEGGRPSFEKFLAEKTDFIVSEMHLPEETSVEFRKIFTEMMQKKAELQRKYSSVHTVMRKARHGETITDEEYQKAVRDDARRAVEDAQLEEQYIARFERVLTPQQLFRYLGAQQRFKSQFMQHGAAGRRPKGDGTAPQR